MLACAVVLSARTALAGELIPAQFPDTSLFVNALRQVYAAPLPARVSGITVPHHLLATDVIANTFARASNGSYDTIVLLSPDHFSLGVTDISVSESGFSTALGDIVPDTTIARAMEQLSFVSPEHFFYREHGLQAETPFIRYYFPHARIVAFTFKETTPKTELDAFIQALEPLLTGRTLVVQSTDFSHYLTKAAASGKDDQTMRVINADDADKVFSLNQPANLDSIAAQYVQMRVQQDVFHARPLIVEHGNSQDYTNEPVAQTTSYIAQAYVPDNAYASMRRFISWERVTRWLGLLKSR